MLSLIYCYDECCYAKCHFAECRYAKCHYAEYHYAECCSARYNAFKNDLVLNFDYRISDVEVKASKH